MAKLEGGMNSLHKPMSIFNQKKNTHRLRFIYFSPRKKNLLFIYFSPREKKLDFLCPKIQFTYKNEIKTTQKKEKGNKKNARKGATAVA